MGIYFLGVSLGNLVTAAVNRIIEIPEVRDPATNEVITAAGARLGPVDYYWFFAGLMAATSVAYIVFAKFFYRGKTFIQGMPPDEAQSASEAEAPDAR